MICLTKRKKAIMSKHERGVYKLHIPKKDDDPAGLEDEVFIYAQERKGFKQTMTFVRPIGKAETVERTIHEQTEKWFFLDPVNEVLEPIYESNKKEDRK